METVRRVSFGWMARAALVVALVACSADGAAVAPPLASASASTPASVPASTSASAASVAPAIAPTGTETTVPGASASNASSTAWPRGLVCGVQAGEVNALGDPVTSRTISLTESLLTLGERSARSSRTADELVAAGFTPGATKLPTFQRTDGERRLGIAFGSSGAYKLDTMCDSPAGGLATADAERAGWIPAHVHRRIGRGQLSSIRVSDGDELYVGAHFTTVEARPDTTGLVDVGHGAFRNAPGAEPECLLILREEPLIVERRSGNAFLVDNALAMHRSSHAK